MNMTKIVSLFGAMFLANIAHANESMMEIAAQKKAKEQLVTSLQHKIEQHRSMTRDQIIADLAASAAQKRTQLEAHMEPAQVTQFFDQGLAVTAELEKEVIIAMEESLLQGILSSQNFIYFKSRGIWDDMHWSSGSHKLTLKVFFLAIVILETLTFPLELVASIATGF